MKGPAIFSEIFSEISHGCSSEQHFEVQPSRLVSPFSPATAGAQLCGPGTRGSAHLCHMFLAKGKGQRKKKHISWVLSVYRALCMHTSLALQGHY